MLPPPYPRIPPPNKLLTLPSLLASHCTAVDIRPIIERRSPQEHNANRTSECKWP
ncbi:hypothetical protein PtB15_4B103 [Puccinia triticina]|nr:hypothetical protein PtB15_4B103 [Puccinia triticina]